MKWYYVQALRESGASETGEPSRERKNFEKSRKKFLTKADRCGKIWNRCDSNRRLESCEWENKKVQKTWKKFLTKAWECGKIKARRWGERRAPCKLNNVTNTKHQKDWLFKEVSKEAWMDNVN